MFSFCPSIKYRKLSEVRANKAEHCVILEELLPGSSGLNNPKPSTENMEVQRGEN